MCAECVYMFVHLSVSLCTYVRTHARLVAHVPCWGVRSGCVHVYVCWCVELCVCWCVQARVLRVNAGVRALRPCWGAQMAVGNRGSGGRGDSGHGLGMAVLGKKGTSHAAHKVEDGQVVAGVDGTTVSEGRSTVEGKHEHGAQGAAARRGSGTEGDGKGVEGMVSEALEALDSYLTSVLMPDLSALARHESGAGQESGGGKGGTGVVDRRHIPRDILLKIIPDMCRGDLRYRSVARLQQAAQMRDESNPFGAHGCLLHAYLPLISACQHSCIPNALAVAAVRPVRPLPCLTLNPKP